MANQTGLWNYQSQISICLSILKYLEFQSIMYYWNIHTNISEHTTQTRDTGE